MMKDYKQMPQLMAEQKQNDQKDKYIEITNCLLEAEKEITESDRLDYAKALIETLKSMDFQVYELYRSLQEAYIRSVDILYSSMPEDGTLRQIIADGKSLSLINADKYVEDRFAAVDLKPETIDGLEEITLEEIKTGGRFAVIKIADGGKYNTTGSYDIYVNDALYGRTDKTITSIYDLKPSTEYRLTVVDKAVGKCGRLNIETDSEYVTLNVREFGAAGDGIKDDTKFIQAAILSAPAGSRVLIPAGKYRITSLFLASNISMELAEGAELIAINERAEYVKFPALLYSNDGSCSEYMLGTWEGNPLPAFAGIITGVNVHNVTIYGRGTINGNASRENWWKDPKKLNIAYRPRLFFINNCDGVTLQGVTCKNSPSWTLHPFFSDNVGIYDVFLNNPSDSPNTDGIDPESCKNVDIAGVHFSLGDDCIAVKSGKIYLGRKYKKPSENVHIYNCLMENGHGAVTIGSEMAGGVKNLLVENCNFSHTDRGLRIKTRRGRGKDAIVDGITFRDIDMDNVMTPFTANAFYFCDPDGKTEYVQSREPYPVDERTPEIKKMVFKNIKAENCHVAATYFEGLPEKKIEEIEMSNIYVNFALDAKTDCPILSEGVEKSSKRGMFIKNVKKLTLHQVVVEGQEEQAIVLEDIDEIARD